MSIQEEGPAESRTPAGKFANRATLVQTKVDVLDAHPANPRIGGLHRDVVDAIASTLRRDSFAPYFAPVGRRVGDRVQLIKGHHQVEAARRAGVETIPIWIVEDMTDEEALELVATSNVQRELSKLEMAVHSFAVTTPAKGRKNEGLQAFARQVGLTLPALSRYRKGAEVFMAIRGAASDDVVRGCRDRAEHLAVIHGAPPDRWMQLVERCVLDQWSLEETRKAVTAPSGDVGTPQPSWLGSTATADRLDDRGSDDDVPNHVAVPGEPTSTRHPSEEAAAMARLRDALAALEHAIEQLGQVLATWNASASVSHRAKAVLSDHRDRLTREKNEFADNVSLLDEILHDDDR